MRIVFVAVFSMVFVGVLVFTLFETPQPQAPSIQSPRVDLEVVARPGVQSQADDQKILEFFPDPSESQVMLNIVENTPAEPARDVSKPATESNESLDRNRLLAFVDDWTYVQFSQVGQKKTGRIHQTRQDTFIDVTEGQEFDNGITVTNLDKERLTLKFGEAVYHLRLAIKPDFFEELREKPRPLTQDEQKKAYEYYMKRFGDKFKAFSRNYNPPMGGAMPQRITPEQRQEALQQYRERYGRQFQQQNQGNPPSTSYTENQAENFRAYWMKHHPNKPMPNFEDINKMREAGPASRMNPSSSP